MELNEKERTALGVALNEARLLGFEVDTTRRMGAATFQVLTLPEQGPPPQDSKSSVFILACWKGCGIAS